MTSFDERSIQCEVRTYKEGLLSRVGHDLSLRARRLHVQEAAASEAPARWHVTVAVHDLRVAGALRDGVVDAAALSAGDKRKIEATLRQTVLPVATATTVEAWLQGPVVVQGRMRVAGQLRLAGQVRAVTWEGAADLDAARVQLHTSLDVRDFGLRPYRAAFGGLKVKPRVDVTVTVAGDALAALRGVA